VTVAFFAEEFESQESPERLLGGNHGRAGEFGLANDFREAEVTHQGYKDKESAEACAKRAWRQVEGTDIGAGGWLGLSGGRSLVVASSR
jgi:hypothetical protein